MSLWIINSSLATKIQISLPFREVDSNYLLIDKTALKGNIGVLWGVEKLIAEVADTYSLDYTFYSKIIDCECGLNRTHESCIGDSGLAFGRLQFHKATFEENCDGSYTNEEDQIKCGAKMISEGKGKAWSCYSKLIKTLTDK